LDFAAKIKRNFYLIGSEGLIRVAFEFPFQNSFKIRNLYFPIHSDYVIQGIELFGVWITNISTAHISTK